MLLKYFKNIFVVLLLLMSISACNHKPDQPDTSQVKIDFKFRQFEKELFSKSVVTADDVHGFQKNYGDFFRIFTTRIIRMPGTSDSAIAMGLNYFKNDTDIKVVYADVKKQYDDLTWLHQDFEDAFRNYKYYFPKKPVPQVVTYISAFNYKNIRLDSILGISLEFYLGADCIYYPSLNFPQYLTKHFTKDYIVTDCIQSLYQTDYEQNPTQSDLLSQMIYFGKMYYFSKQLTPDIDDTIRTGYTKKQMDWVIKNESKVWTVIIENKLLFSTDFSQYNKFIAEGNTTSGFPADAPAAIGKWIGYQIVKKYMNEHSEVSLDMLLNEKDSQKIFSESKYKPGK